jgi:hypothetical protein
MSQKNFSRFLKNFVVDDVDVDDVDVDDDVDD